MGMYGGIILGLVLLIAGGELLVRGAVSSARTLGVSPLMIGLTLVGFGTSTPELVTSVTAALAGSPGIAVGNVVGSNIANILLILGVAALIYPLSIDVRGFKRDAIMLITATLACLAVVLHGHMGMLVGCLFVAALLGYLVYVYQSEKRAPDVATVVAENAVAHARSGPRQVVFAIGIALVGIAITILGARFLVDGAVLLAKGYGISYTIIGLTIVAVGTSMPELVTSVMAAMRRQADVAYGNIIGSCLFNSLFILGSTAIIRPIDIPPQIAHVDIWVMLGASAALVFFARSGFTLRRWEGFVFVSGYVAYTAYLISITI